ncbi:MAG TPA: DNA-processing protein DprA [Acidimicrobiales bacterium]|nr:DNA-processing protein DprA [Acidimicrobiales bacterium]
MSEPARAQLAALAALAGLPALGPRRFLALVHHRSPLDAWALASAGDAAALARALGGDRDLDTLARSWRSAADGVDPLAVLAAHEAADVAVLAHPSVLAEPPSPPDGPRYPERLVDDPEPPAVLFARGGPVPAGPSVAIVGTRRCTGTGAGMARELGRELAAAGVHVISGLALGIDGAAHRGALDARSGHPDAASPIGVVGSGPDVAYPTRHRDLWEAVAAEGTLLSEAPLGARPAGWRFPCRNRLIAALADVVVVVESHAAGGSLHTVHEAIRRDVDVMAVPGSVRSPAAAGTNQLLAEGCPPVRDAGDVLVALGLVRGRRRRPVEHRPLPGPDAAAVLDALGWEPATFEHLAVRCGLGLAELAVALEELVAGGWVSQHGGWYEQRATA